MLQKERSFLDNLGKANFKFFYRLVKMVSQNLGRRFLYTGLADNSIYEESFKDPILNISVLGKNFPSPLGIASGFDTSFKYNDTLVQYGFGFEEFGTFTLKPSYKFTRLHFLNGQQSILVSQPSFENNGLSFLQKSLISRRHLPHIAGISISSNTEQNEDAPETLSAFDGIQKELLEITQRTAPYCDYIVLNLSHPHLAISNLLANLRLLEATIQQMQYAISKVAPITKPKLLIKLPSNILPQNVSLIADTLLNAKIDGIIVAGYLGDTRQSSRLAGKPMSGLICGKPIKDISTKLVADFYKATKGSIPIIACGGIFTGEDAFDKIQNGASLIQIHSSILFNGPGVGNEISKELAFLLKKYEFKNVSEAVGSKINGVI